MQTAAPSFYMDARAQTRALTACTASVLSRKSPFQPPELFFVSSSKDFFSIQLGLTVQTLGIEALEYIYPPTIPVAL